MSNLNDAKAFVQPPSVYDEVVLGKRPTDDLNNPALASESRDNAA
jgi:hypothetical protein